MKIDKVGSVKSLFDFLPCKNSFEGIYQILMVAILFGPSN